MMTKLTQERVKELLQYDPLTGVFLWRERPYKARVAIGQVAGTVLSNGYRQIKIGGRKYSGHRLAWFYIHGVWPADGLDHRNGNPDDNRLLNLREATAAQNNQNLTLSKRNTSGYLGVSWNCKRKMWQAHISAAGVHKTLGYRASKEGAHALYLAAKASLHTFNPTLRP